MKKLIVCLAMTALLAAPAVFAGGEGCSKAQAQGCPAAKSEACAQAKAGCPAQQQAKASCPAQQQVKACCPLQGKTDQAAKTGSTDTTSKGKSQTVASRK
ncbi:MAG TPA: hypothetical protein P5186_02435 [Candidatus Paceibacterota bacterium]|nr:hypothetical protein [Verrucomicrobiota bacterium]HRY46880.1 hypothetical protein [Candidatus Paceibacterota bacterium]